jgi:hypothetical protein
MDHVGWSFLCGWAPTNYFIFAARERDDASARGVAASGFYFWNERDPDPNEKWRVYNQVANWRAQGMASVKPASANRILVALGAQGQYFEVDPSTMTKHLGKLGIDALVRRVTAIGDNIFAAGMGRSVIRRIQRGTWIEFGPGTTDADQDKVIGFEGIDGFSPDDIYVAGWRGEIWRWSGAAWRQIDSPTNANLNALVCSADGFVFAVGDDGTMVRGAGELWDVVDTGRLENLQDVAVLGDDVFVVTDYRILKLGPTGLEPEDRFANGDTPETCLHLLRTEDDSGLVSMGPKDLFVFSGGVWRRIV